MSKLEQLQTCLNLMTTKQNSCLSHLIEIGISITYLLQSLSAMLKLPSSILWRIWILHLTDILLWMHTFPILLKQATLSCCLASICGFLTSKATATLNLLLFFQELATVTHCCLFPLMMWHPAFNGYRIIPNVTCAPSLSLFKSHLNKYLLCSFYKDWNLSLINVHMCMIWPCHGLVDCLS